MAHDAGAQFDSEISLPGAVEDVDDTVARPRAVADDLAVRAPELADEGRNAGSAASPPAAWQPASAEQEGRPESQAGSVSGTEDTIAPLPAAFTLAGLPVGGSPKPSAALANGADPREPAAAAVAVGEPKWRRSSTRSSTSRASRAPGQRLARRKRRGSDQNVAVVIAACVMALLLWLAVPLDDGTGRVRPLPFALAFHGIYCVFAFFVALSMYDLVLPAPPTLRMVLLGAAYVAAHWMTVFVVVSQSDDVLSPLAKRLCIAASLGGYGFIVFVFLALEAARLELRQKGGGTMCCVVIDGRDADDDDEGRSQVGSPTNADDDVDVDDDASDDQVSVLSPISFGPPSRSESGSSAASADRGHGGGNGRRRGSRSSVAKLYRRSELARAVGDGEEYHKPTRIFAHVFLGLTCVLWAYAFCQVFTALVIEYRDDIGEAARVCLLVVFHMSLVGARNAARAVTSSSLVRSSREHMPDGLATMFAYAIDTMGFGFQRNLFVSFVDLRSVAVVMAARYLIFVVNGPPLRFTWAWHTFSGRLDRAMWGSCRCARARCCRGEPSVEPPATTVSDATATAAAAAAATTPTSTLAGDGTPSAVIHIDVSSPPFAKDGGSAEASAPTRRDRSAWVSRCERLLVAHMHTRLASAVALVSWYSFTAWSYYGHNVDVFPYREQVQEVDPEVGFERVTQVLGLVALYEAAALAASWWQARRVSAGMWSFAVQSITRAPWRVKLALVALSVHVVQDVPVALITSSALSR
uniref:Uncharacterized protein n=1 Tax=Bicosoecida sp. CB-2014 TaxID=1486930 RepID=A0A7S1GDB6_9STRA|mmetsp:Transcript_5225/g.18795  ORF Transcript_5225/g.18795 Transcript_5225/m.18795 type:complete len:753 (+) Transcript_5225:441-2699(+)